MLDFIKVVVVIVLLIPAIPFIIFCVMDDMIYQWYQEVTFATDKHYGKESDGNYYD